MATAVPISPVHIHADFHIQRLPDEIDHHLPISLLSSSLSSRSSPTFVFHFYLRNTDRSAHYSASPSQQDEHQILSVRTQGETLPLGSHGSALMVVRLRLFMIGDVPTWVGSNFHQLFHLPECCHIRILTGLRSYLATISNGEDLHSGRNGTGGLVYFTVEISGMLDWSSDGTTSLNVPNPEPEVSTQRSDLLQRVKREELEREDGDQDGSCAICLEKLTAKEEEAEVLRLPCSHVFHGGCILKWLERHDSCPLCRFVLRCSAVDLEQPHDLLPSLVLYLI
ncbi:hypothetical protein Ancab_038921 [Ancistrocladus abbreviatus]